MVDPTIAAEIERRAALPEGDRLRETMAAGRGERPRAVPVAEWGKDHWSTLAYAETCCVDNGRGGIGRLSIVRMRCDADRHPLLAHHDTGRKYPTRLKGGAELADHDDWDCLEDAERAGYCVVLSLVNGFVRLTPRGERVCAALRAHKARGGNFADFVPPKRLLRRKP